MFCWPTYNWWHDWNNSSHKLSKCCSWRQFLKVEWYWYPSCRNYSEGKYHNDISKWIITHQKHYVNIISKKSLSLLIISMRPNFHNLIYHIYDQDQRIWHVYYMYHKNKATIWGIISTEWGVTPVIAKDLQCHLSHLLLISCQTDWRELGQQTSPVTFIMMNLPMTFQWNCNFLHHRLWISLWIKSIYNELDITIHVIAS